MLTRRQRAADVSASRNTAERSHAGYRKGEKEGTSLADGLLLSMPIPFHFNLDIRAKKTKKQKTRKSRQFSFNAVLLDTQKP
jgi:hypothetical protein